MKELTEDFCEEIIKKRGYIFVKLYKHDGIRVVTFKDNNDYYYETLWENFKSSQNFKPITQSNPYTIQNIKKYLKNNNIPIELISNTFVSVTDKLEFKMACGHHHELSWSKLNTNAHYLCPKCCLSVRGKNHKVKEQSVKDLFIKNNLILLEKYNRSNESLLCVDNNGYKGRISYNNLKCGKKFNIFGANNDFVIENISQWLFNNNINLKIISSKYFNCDTPLEWKCSCGNSFYKCWDYIRSKKGLCCENCFNKSNNENIVQKYLLTKGVNFQREYRFEDCIHIRPLPFDFYIKSKNLCIEIDGEGHFNPTTFGGISEEQAIKNFENQQLRDNIKTNYCKNNNIKLLRLSYRDFKTNEYKNKINQWIV